MLKNYVGVIHKDEDSDYGVSFPDFLGCISLGSTIDEAKDMATEALQGHIDTMLEVGEDVPHTPKPLEDIINSGEVEEDGFIAYIVITAKIPDSSLKRINISIGSDLLNDVDSRVERLGMSRSGWLAQAARHELENRV